MKTKPGLLAAGALSAALTMAGCASGPTYSEGPGYGGQRTRIDNQKMDCTVVTQRSGTLRGGTTTQQGDGSFTERCVSSTHANQRQSGTSPQDIITREMQRTGQGVANDVGNEVRSTVRGIIRDALNFN